jgi:hypothetical protein
MMTPKTQEILFQKFDEILWDNEVYDSTEVFRTLNAYQNARLDKIEKTNNKTERIALQRTLDYFDIDFIEKYRKSKNKEKLLFKLVNSFALQITELKHINNSTYSKYVFEEIISFKNKILSNKEWYLRVIPETKWIIDYLENLK